MDKEKIVLPPLKWVGGKRKIIEIIQSAAENIEKLPILPQGMNTKHPTWNNIRYFFRNVHLALIIQGEKSLQVSVKGITELHDQLMRLLEVPGKV